MKRSLILDLLDLGSSVLCSGVLRPGTEGALRAAVVGLGGKGVRTTGETPREPELCQGGREGQREGLGNPGMGVGWTGEQVRLGSLAGAGEGRRRVALFQSVGVSRPKGRVSWERASSEPSSPRPPPAPCRG